MNRFNKMNQRFFVHDDGETIEVFKWTEFSLRISAQQLCIPIDSINIINQHPCIDWREEIRSPRHSDYPHIYFTSHGIDSTYRKQKRITRESMEQYIGGKIPENPFLED